MKTMFLTAAYMLGFVFLQSGCSSAEARVDNLASDKQISENIGKSGAENKAGTVNKKITKVKVEKVSPATLTEYVIARGVTVAKHDVTYSAEVAGKLGKLNVDLGDRVKKGQVLARIDYQALAAQAKQAKANFDLAKTTHERLAQLKSEELVSQQQIDEALSRLTSARAQLTIARIQLSKSTVLAGRKGIVSKKYVEKSEFVAPGVRLYDVIDYDTIVVDAQIPETQVSSVVVGSIAEVEIGGLGEIFKGIVSTIIPSADKVSKTFTIRVDVDNPELKILVGMSASVSIVVRIHDNAVVAKQSTVVEAKDGQSVFVVENNIAQKRRVELGPYENDRVLITSGLLVGDDLVVVGQRDLRDKQQITIVE